MKKYSYLFLSLMSLLFIAASCDSPMDENPVLQKPTTFVLNTPALAESLYDLANTENLTLTCSQPDYGYAAAASYTVQISTDNDWTSDKVQTYTPDFTSCIITMSANDLDVLICQALGVVSAEEMPTSPIPVYVRVQSKLSNVADSEIYSNVITLKQVMPYYALPDVALPTEMYMIGKFCEWNFDNSATMIAVNGNPDRFWTIRYVKAGEGFKFSLTKDWTGKNFGYDTSIMTVTNSAAGAVSADGDGNIVVETSGWYIFSVSTSIVGRDYNYSLDILAPNVYVYGAANGGSWDNSDAWKFDVIDDPDAEFPFVSPTVLATDGSDSSCLRLCIHPTEWSTIDWWRTEFIFFDGTISYRADGGDQDRVGNVAGKVYLNFVTGKGKVE